ncbi:uncharacterized protein [Rutidosis leptorrhynchoides]|uniref:uncharacterized protein n=1 Tax=Rutidosis leptorrhynchoides TaxID=125765 RepID=UPI003A990558
MNPLNILVEAFYGGQFDDEVKVYFGAIKQRSILMCGSLSSRIYNEDWYALVGRFMKWSETIKLYTEFIDDSTYVVYSEDEDEPGSPYVSERWEIVAVEKKQKYLNRSSGFSVTGSKQECAAGCVQETRWKGEGAVDIKDYRLWYSGSRIARNGVGIFLGNLHKDNVVDVGRFSDRIMSVSLIIKEETFTVISAYAPHAGLSDAEKKSFWELLDEVVRGCPADHRLIIGGDLNGHIGVEAEGYEGAYGGFGFGPRNEEGRSIVEFAIAHELVVANSFFKKRDAQLATFYSGGRCTQIDFLLLRKGELRTCRDCKVLPAYTCSSQHRLLIMDLVSLGRVRRRAKVVQHRILWKNLHGAKAETFRTTVADRLSVEGDNVAPANVDQLWNRMASTIREVAKEALRMALGTSRAHKSSRESWWLSDDVQTKVALKQMRKLDSKEGANDIYRIAKARERRGRDLVNVKYIKDEAGQSIVREDLIKKRWEEYFASLFGRERTEWNGELREVREYQNNCYCTRINQEEVRSALRKMGRNKAVGPDQIPIEAWRCLGGDGVRWLTNLFNTTFRSAKMPMEWMLSEGELGSWGHNQQVEGRTT